MLENLGENELGGISEESLERLENLLDHSLQGVHLLFDNSRVAKILSIPTDDDVFFEGDNVTKVQDLLTNLISKETMFEKLCFTHSLSEGDYETLVRAYFHILERAAKASDHELH